MDALVVFAVWFVVYLALRRIQNVQNLPGSFPITSNIIYQHISSYTTYTYLYLLQEEQLRVLIAQFTNHPEQDKRGRRRYRDSVHWGAVAKVNASPVYLRVVVSLYWCF